MIKLLQPLEEIGYIYAFNKEKQVGYIILSLTSSTTDAFRMHLPQDGSC
jgi:hypothetical protein